MSEFRKGEIKLDASKAVFYAGQLVSGEVCFDVSEPIRFSEIKIEYVGEAEVLWTETIKEKQYGQTRVKTVEYKGTEEYFNHTERLAGGTGVTEIPPGHHSLPFKFHIPHNVPSSFMGEVGKISYNIKATIIYNTVSEMLVKEITVIAPFNLNIESPDIKKPINLEFEEVYGCDCICTPKPMNIRVNTPVTGYCAGQEIPITVQVDNESGIEIRKMVFELIYRERYRSHQLPGEYIPSEKTLAKAKTGAIMSKSKKSVRVSLQVPSVLPPILDNCSIIDVAYFIKVTFKLSGCNSDLTDEAEICLGIIPLNESITSDYVNPLEDILPDGPVPDPNAPLEFAPRSQGYVQPAENPYLSEPGQNMSALNIEYSSSVLVSNVGYSQGNTNAPYPAQMYSYPSNNSSRPSSGSYGFALPPILPGYLQNVGIQPGYVNGNSNLNSTGIGPTAPPPYM